MSNNKYEALLEEALDNIRADRILTSHFMAKVKKLAEEEGADHTKLGFIVAKYLETLQRSNDQLVKLTSLKAKKAAPESEGMTPEERRSMFEEIKESKESKG